MLTFKYVILGGGVAAGYAAREFLTRGLGPGLLCIISSEPVVAYERPCLSKGFLRPTGAERLPDFHTCAGKGWKTQDKDWYARHGIQYFVGVTVTKAVVSGSKLLLDNGEEVEYGKLIVATGARAVTLRDLGMPGCSLKGVHHMHCLEDAEEIVKSIESCKRQGGRAFIIGAGYIGMEVAAALHEHGLHVTMAFPGGMLMDRILPHNVAVFYEDYYTRKGVDVFWDQRVVKLSGSRGRVEKVELRRGRCGGEAAAEDVEEGDEEDDTEVVEASLVVAGIGTRPNAELFKEQLEMSSGGIDVDGQLRSSAPNVYAVGDVAAFPLLRDGGRKGRQEHVTHARQSAMHVVSAILDPGNTSSYDYLPVYYSRFFNLSWEFHGIRQERGLLFGDLEKGKFGMYFVDGDDRIVGAFLEGGTSEELEWIRAVARARPKCVDGLGAKGLEFAAQVARMPAQPSMSDGQSLP